jgi:hypothetical protein
MEENWLAAADSGRRNRPPDNGHRKKAHSAAIAGVIAGTVLLVGLDAFAPGKSVSGIRNVVKIGPTSVSFGVRVPTASEKLDDMKSGRIFPGSMLADEAVRGPNSSDVIDGKIELQPSPEGPLAHVIFTPPKDIDYKVKVDVYMESRKRQKNDILPKATLLFF